MDRMKMMSRDVVGGNVRKIAALFPQCVTERLDKDGKPELAIDFVHLARQACGIAHRERAHHNDAPPRPCIVG